METTKITSKGQITIPRKIRTALAVDVGDRLAFEVDGEGRLSVRPVRQPAKPLRGFLAEYAGGAKSGEAQVRAALRRRAAQKHRRLTGRLSGTPGARPTSRTT